MIGTPWREEQPALVAVANEVERIHVTDDHC